jgi:hypothetical protein
MQNYLIEGVLHITDIEGYDHMLFLLAMCSPFSFKDWRPVVILATAFTVGHSISLALAAFDVIRFSSSFIEFLIPVTIALTSIYNLTPFGQSGHVHAFRYVSAGIFGVIHGMGFSSFFRMISSEGQNFIAQLFLFNIGVELGQLLIVAAILLLIALVGLAIPGSQRILPKILASAALLLSLLLAIEKWPA